MDWANSDYGQQFADTFYTPEPNHDAGIYLLDEASQDTDSERERVVRAPIRAQKSSREGFYGNIISDRGDLPAVYNVAWDPRPQHYNPNTGAEWAHLVPPPHARPYGGGPAPSLAYPKVPYASDGFLGGHGRDTGCQCGGGRPRGDSLQFIKFTLLIIIVVLLAMTLATMGRMTHNIKKMIREAVIILGTKE